MSKQLKTRLSSDVVALVLAKFNAREISADEACVRLGVGRSRLYTLKTRWLRQGTGFRLGTSGGDTTGGWPPEAEAIAERLVILSSRPGGKPVNYAIVADCIQCETGRKLDRTCIKGGLWHDVYLVEEPAARFADVCIDPAEDLHSVRIRGTIDNAGPAGAFSLAVTLVEDALGAGRDIPTKCPPSGHAVGVSLPGLAPLSLVPGANAFDITIPASDAKPWSPDDPNLYWAALTLTDAAGKPVSTHLERFGFRTMRIRGDRFYLNGKPFYPVGDSLHSLHYGGKGTDEAVARLRRDLAAHKANGANTLRTAHMPAIPEVYDFADEIGLVIYDEWANSFCNHIDEEAFERSNLPAFETWIRRDYNHPCVALWSLGNEVKHQDPEVARQLDKQYDLAKALDGQHRPMCAFSGVADTWNYGSDRVKTDFLDTHDYLGIDGDCWPTWFRSMDRHHADMAAVFGEDGKLEMPLIMWECVGGGWDIRHDDDMKPGDRARYLDWMRKWSHWGAPPGIPFSASAAFCRSSTARAGATTCRAIWRRASANSSVRIGVSPVSRRGSPTRAFPAPRAGCSRPTHFSATTPTPTDISCSASSSAPV